MNQDIAFSVGKANNWADGRLSASLSQEEI